ncbi:MAG: SDR family oxidoreductase [Solirubrobacterales bacterium]|nr:SDR family oxidoreductase [Solirubrobacterales bacterium]MCB8969275.1 SDR family oxidoreductase [Thermoleophilales bacterium]MCO5328208.1 SDR family oxidoreductase [Solirubrobacterales bacterium]
MSSSRTVLITGCSTGIGRASALRLDAAGWRVFAGVRKEEDAESIAAAGSDRLQPVIVDVTDSASIDLCRERVEKDCPEGVYGLVNNAGAAHVGPLEVMPLEDMRRQFEVNFVGHVAMTQALVPSLRKTKGRIVNVTSVGGLVSTPFFGPYCASKYALEAVSDCLRVELRPWGIKTIAIEPGSVATEIWESGTQIFAELREELGPEAIELYGDALEATARAAAETGKRGIPAEHAAEVVERALTARRPRARYLVGRDAYGMTAAKRLLPAKLHDRLTARVLRLP